MLNHAYLDVFCGLMVVFPFNISAIPAVTIIFVSSYPNKLHQRVCVGMTVGGRSFSTAL